MDPFFFFVLPWLRPHFPQTSKVEVEVWHGPSVPAEASRNNQQFRQDAVRESFGDVACAHGPFSAGRDPAEAAVIGCLGLGKSGVSFFRESRPPKKGLVPAPSSSWGRMNWRNCPMATRPSLLGLLVSLLAYPVFLSTACFSLIPGAWEYLSVSSHLAYPPRVLVIQRPAPQIFVFQFAYLLAWATAAAGSQTWLDSVWSRFWVGLHYGIYVRRRRTPSSA